MTINNKQMNKQTKQVPIFSYSLALIFQGKLVFDNNFSFKVERIEDQQYNFRKIIL